MAKKKSFDPDNLVLTKPEILEFCDRVLKKWNKNPTKNANNILAMNAVKTSILWTDDESLKAIWSEILKWNFETVLKNAIEQMKKENAPEFSSKLEYESTKNTKADIHGEWF